MGLSRKITLNALLATWSLITATALSEPILDPRDGFFEQYCFECHGADMQKAGISLRSIPDRPSNNRELGEWRKIAEALNSRMMPPDGATQPSPEERRSTAEWIETRMREAMTRLEPDPPPATTRRLTNFEYENTIRDLLGVELKLAKFLPDDPALPFEFDNATTSLLLGRERLARYEENAKRAMQAAIVDREVPPQYRARREWPAENGKNELAIEGNRRGSVAEGLSVREWPEHGEYRIRIKAAGAFPDGTAELPLRLVMGYALAGDIGAAPFEPVGTIRITKEDNEPRVYEFRGRIENHPWEPERKYRRGGKRTGRLVTTPASMVITPQNLFDDGTLNDKLDLESRPRAVIEWIEFEAPIVEPWPPEHHDRILFDSPIRETEREDYVREVLRRFLMRAFRRPLGDDEVERYVQIYRIFAGEGQSIEQSMRATFSVSLTSPNFLYHVADLEGESRHYAIANRLSYFLWGSMPDQRLFQHAANGRLDAPEIIAAEVRRMLLDERSRDFVRNFTRQWLALERCRTIPINTDSYPRFLHLVERGQHRGEEVPFRPTIRDDMVEETVAFIGELIDRNESLLQIVDSDFAMLNERLAAHYRVPNVSGHQLRRVALAGESTLGGLLTHGSVLIGTGTGSAPHPIYRAVWLREAILGEEVKDPPADVPALAESTASASEANGSIAERLSLHRTKQSCNECHARLDPWGLPFEHYNAIGRYQPRVPKQGVRVRGFDRKRHRDLDGYRDYLDEINTVPVQAQAKLPGGPSVEGLDDLKAFLVTERADDIACNVVRRLFVYALGRKLSERERFEIVDLVADLRAEGYPMQDVIIAICQSQLFLK